MADPSLRSDRDTSSFLAAIIESSDDAIIGKGLDGRILTWNRGAERMYGYTAGEVVGQLVSILIPPDKRDELDGILARIARGERVAPHDTVRVSKAGHRLDVALTVSPIRDADGRVLGASAIARDITERRRLDAELHASDARWQAIVESAIDGIIVIDQLGSVESFNGAAERLFGYASADVIGRNVKMLMPSPYDEEHDDYLARHAATGERHVIGVGRQVLGRRQDGSVFPLHLSVGEIRRGDKRRYVGMVHDLTERVRTEERIREQAALARLGEMAAVIAHEVRNPLAAVSGAIQLISEALPIESQEATIAKEVLARIDALNALTNDLLLFARPPRPNIGPVDVAVLLHAIVRLLSADASLTGVRIEIDHGPAAALGDVDLLTIVLQNMLINAAQAMKGAGTISISLRTTGAHVLVTIRDTGPGIPAQVRERLFQPFVTTKARGTGLGLSTAKRLIEAMQGTIALDCPPEGGTIVTIGVPVDPRASVSAT